MYNTVLKLLCEDCAAKQHSPAEKIKPSDLTEDIADDVIELNISQLQSFFSEEAWLLLCKKGEHTCSLNISDNIIMQFFSMIVI